MLKTSQLEIFQAVVDCGSLNKAAEYLNTSQPYLSRVIKEMEEKMGKRLLVRGKQGVYPTRDGKFIYGYAKTIIQNLKKIEELKNTDFAQVEAKLSVSLYSFFLDKDIFLKFLTDNLSNFIQISVLEGNLAQLFDDLLSEKSELGIAVINDIELPSVQSAAIAQNLHYEILDSSPLYVHIGQNQRNYDQEEIAMEDLLYSTYLHIPFDKYSNTRLEIEIDGYKMKEFKQMMSVNHYWLMMYLLQKTDSFMFGNKWQSEFMKRSGIQSKILKNTGIRMHLIIFYKGNKHSPEFEKMRELFCAHYLNQNESEYDITKRI